MIKRLLWNFEIDTEAPYDFENLAKEEKEKLRWERRFFWHDEKIIVLKHANKNLLQLDQWRCKQRQDIYYLFPKTGYNVKERRQRLVYKPLLEKKSDCEAYGSKMDIFTAEPGQVLTEIARLLESSLRVVLLKTVFIYKLPTQPRIRLELSRFEIDKQYYFSACIEGHSYSLVKNISKGLLPNAVSCDYVSFLKKIKHYE